MSGRDWRCDADSVYFIAEAGVNHNGELNLAKQLVDVAAEAGADAVKFQAFQAESLVTDAAQTAEYQETTTGIDTQQEMLSKLELNKDELKNLKEYCQESNVDFLSTPFGFKTASMLADLGVRAFKIGSGDLTNYPLLRHTAEYGRPIVLSTGMSTLDEVRNAFGAIRKTNPDVSVALLHCVSAYPTEMADVNLRAVRTLDEKFPVPVGFSDHTTAIETPALSVTVGARIVEKHFTLDRTMEGPDHKASLEPKELAKAVSLVRDAARALGDGIKRPIPAEEDVREVVRKGLYAATELDAGETLSKTDIRIKRPPEGLPPSEYERVIGRTLSRDVSVDEPLTETHFKEQ